MCLVSVLVAQEDLSPGVVNFGVYIGSGCIGRGGGCCDRDGGWTGSGDGCIGSGGGCCDRGGGCIGSGDGCAGGGGETACVPSPLSLSVFVVCGEAACVPSPLGLSVLWCVVRQRHHWV